VEEGRRERGRLRMERGRTGGREEGRKIGAKYESAWRNASEEGR
jgi:hypothetical protein